MKDHLVNHLLYYNDNLNGEFGFIIDNIKKQIDFLMTFVDPIKTNVVFNIGALNGVEAILLSNHLPKSHIFLFEASLVPFKLILDNVSGIPNITSVLCGLGNSDGSAILNLFRNPGLNSFLEECSDLELFDKKLLAEAVPISKSKTYCLNNNIKKVDLVYIDVQGFEIEVFKGFEDMIKNVSVIQAECSWKPKYKNQPSYKDVCDYLNQFGFVEKAKQIDYVDGCDDCDVIFVNERI